MQVNNHNNGKCFLDRKFVTLIVEGLRAKGDLTLIILLPYIIHWGNYICIMVSVLSEKVTVITVLFPLPRERI